MSFVFRSSLCLHGVLQTPPGAARGVAQLLVERSPSSNRSTVVQREVNNSLAGCQTVSCVICADVHVQQCRHPYCTVGTALLQILRYDTRPCQPLHGKCHANVIMITDQGNVCLGGGPKDYADPVMRHIS